MKVSELISVLHVRLQRWGDVEVVGAWAGLTSGLEPKHVYRRRDDVQPNQSQRPALVIDLDANRYKRSLALDPDEGEEITSGDEDGIDDAHNPFPLP
jgi:hypothetical protein